MRERSSLLCLLVLWTSTEAFLPSPYRHHPANACFVVAPSRHYYRPNNNNQMLSTKTSSSNTVRMSSSTENEDEESSASSSSSSSSNNNPSTFREAEVLGLKLMQEGEYEQALTTFQNGLKLPGSRSDVVRTKRLSGPSPVGGSTGGYESQNIQTLDEFELQAANYNMACALAQLNRPADAVEALRKALENGFDNYATVRSDPDLESLQGLSEFESLMEEYEPKRGGGFNPFGLFGKK